ncbi:unnamed protein product [Schistosoma turkestanicum]|nr:unnamed protein product [Schistosoma turkestanicum]
MVERTIESLNRRTCTKFSEQGTTIEWHTRFVPVTQKKEDSQNVVISEWHYNIFEMTDSHSNGKGVCELSSSPSKRSVDRPLGGIALFGSGNELLCEMKNRLKLRSTEHSDTKELPSEILMNHEVEQLEPSSYDNMSSSVSTNSSPRSSIYDDVEQSEFKTVSDILLNRARKPPTRKPTLSRSLDAPNRQPLNTSSTSCLSHLDDNSPKILDGLTEFFNSNG